MASNSQDAAKELRLVRDGTITGPNGTEIDFRNDDGSVWVTIKADEDATAEYVAACFAGAFPEPSS